MVPAMSADETTRKAAGRILAWYEAMGVDAALEEHPLDWLARGGVAPGAQFSLQASSFSDAGCGCRSEQARGRTTATGDRVLRSHQLPSRRASSRRARPPHATQSRASTSMGRARWPNSALCLAASTAAV